MTYADNSKTGCGCKKSVPAAESCGCATVEPAGNCGCVSTGPLSLGIASIPMQPWEETYDVHKALERGTIFSSLDLPFYVTGGAFHG